MGLYGDFDLKLGDNDARGRYGGVDQRRVEVRGKKKVTVVLSSIHVAMLQADLLELGFYLAPHGTRPKGTFNRDTELAVKELQRFAKDREWLPQADARGSPGYKRIDGGLDPDKALVQVPQASIYRGNVTGIVDQATRQLIFDWLTNFWRRPYKKMLVTLEELMAIMDILPDAKAVEFLPEMNQAMADAGVDENAWRLASFLAQIALESIKLTAMTELPSAWASSRDRYKGRGAIQLTLRENYEKYACYLSGVTVAALHAYESAPPKRKATMPPVVLDPDLRDKPELVAEKPYRCDCAHWYWSVAANCNPLADGLKGKSGGDEMAQFDRITQAINGGLNGQMDRRALYTRAKSLLGIE